MADNILVDNGANTDFTVRTSESSGVHVQHYRPDLEAAYKTLVDDAGAYLYVGYAQPGTDTSAASWRVARIENATGSKLWADGGSFANVWDDRASLIYS